MHYFKKNIGDYAKKTGRLSMLQHGAYTLLIDTCYDRERFPTMEEAIEWTWASSKEEIEAVEFVLRRFFTLEDGVYVQQRIKEEIVEYHTKIETNKRIAQERESKRKENRTNRERFVNDSSPVVNEAPPNQEPITNNQDKNINAFVPKAALLSIGVTESVAVDWLQIRKAKKSAVTETAIKGLVRECELAGISVNDALVMCCERGWSGFKSEWILNQAKTKTHNPAVLSI